MKRKAWLILIILAALLWMLAIGGRMLFDALLPRYINLAELKHKIETTIEESTGIDLGIHHLAIEPTLFSGIRLRLMGLTAKDPQASVLATAQSVDIDVAYLPVLTQRKNVIHHIRVKQLAATVSPDSYWFKIRLPKRPAQDVVIEDCRLDISGYRFHVFNVPQPGDVVGQTIVLRHLQSSKPITVRVAQTVYQLPQSQKVLLTLQQLQGVLNHQKLAYHLALNMQLQHQPLMVKGTWHPKTQQIEGSVQSQSLSLQTLQQAMGLFVRLAPFQKDSVVAGQLSGQWFWRGLLNQPLKWLWHGHGQLKKAELGSFAQPQHRLRQVDAEWRITPEGFTIKRFKAQLAGHPITLTAMFNTRTRQLAGHLLTQRLDLQALAGWQNWLNRQVPTPFQLPVSGRLSADVTVLGSFDRPQLTGWTQLEDVRYAVHRHQMVQASGTLTFKKHRWHADSLKLLLKESPVVLTGWIEPWNNQIAMQIQASRVSLEKLQSFLAPFNLSLAFQQYKAMGELTADIQVSGPLKRPSVQGVARLNQVAVTLLQQGVTVKQITGVFRAVKDTVFVEKLTGSLEQTPFSVSGLFGLNTQKYQLRIQATHAQLPILKRVLQQYFLQQSDVFKTFNITQGTANIDIQLNNSLPRKVGGLISLHNVVTYASPQSNQPIKLSQASYNLTTGKVYVPASGIQWQGIGLGVHGVLQWPQYHLNVSSAPMALSTLRDFQQQFSGSPVALPTLFNAVGKVAFSALLTPQTKTMTVQFYNAGGSFQQLKYPIYDVNGAVSVAMGRIPRITSEKLTLRYANSPFSLVIDGTKLNDIYLEAKGTLAPLLLNDLLLAQNNTAVIFAAIPFEINTSGRFGMLWGKPVDNNFQTFVNLNIASLFNRPRLETPNDSEDDSLNQASLSSVVLVNGDNIEVEQTHFKASENSKISLSGYVHHLLDPLQREAKLLIQTEPVLDLSAFAHQVQQEVTEGLAGTIEAGLNFISNAKETGLFGTVRFNHVHSNTLELQDLQGTLQFEGQKGNLEIDHIQISGVEGQFRADLPELFRYPLPVTNFHLLGSQFIVSLYTEWMGNVITGKLRKGLWEQFFPNTGRVGTLPFEIVNGTVQLNEGIVNNLIIENYRSQIKVYPNAYFELNRAEAESAGGTVSGSYAMNPRYNNFMMVRLDIDKMKANAVSRILLNVTNQIFGDLSGVIDYTTEGYSSDEMLSRTNGVADLRIENGRLPAIAKMENLLVAANTVSGGLANLNLNSLLRIAAPFRTDYFATLTGTFKMVEGLIYTDDLISDGQNLDLIMRGQIRLVDGEADMLVHGEMDREIGGVLGPFGDLSIGRLFGFFPPLQKIISHIPGLGFVPGFGGPKQKGVAFEVTVQGPPTDPGSVKNFKWVQ